MSDIRVISAGAGTGKTHRLAEELVGALLEGAALNGAGIEPEGVVAVTYTRAAAAELEARVRQALIERGQMALAQRLAGARIGTVHSVCTRLVEEHAFALGMPPEIRTVDERAAALLFDDALQAVIDDEERLKLDELEQRCRGIPFEDLCREVADRARSNDLDDDALERSRLESREALLLNLPPVGDGGQIEGALRVALDDILVKFTVKEHASQNARDEHARLSRAKDTLARGEPLPWGEWLGLEESRVKKQAQAHIEHPQLRDDLCALIDLVFGTARRAMARFAEDKRQAGVVDFIDQEKLALSLLLSDQTRQQVQQGVQLLLVDEFQDTSPLQFALFDALSTVAHRTIVVGDEKQSIFGFRDASPELFKRFQERASSTDRLGTSYRSRPGLVHAVSAVFGKAFAAAGLDEEAVKLVPVADPDSAVTEPLLGVHVERWWQEPQGPEDDKRSDEDLAAAGVAEILSKHEVLVRASSSSSPSAGVRPAQAKDIAILCRTNAACRVIASALADRGVPALMRRRGLGETFEARVIASAFGLWLDRYDALAAAALVRLLGDDANAEGFLADVVAGDKGHAHLVHPLVVAVVDAAVFDRHAGVVSAFDRVVDVLRLRDRLPTFGDGAQRLADLAALRALCVRFIDDALARGRGPTVAGLLARLEELRGLRDDDDDPDDERGDVAGIDAVSVLTWHKSKGREWPVVVLTGLWKSPWVRPFDVVVESELLSLDTFANPLFGRRLRVWPSPYGETARGGLAAHLKDSPQVQRMKRAATQESLRLLYVGFTRAKDKVVVVGDSAIWSRGMMSALVINDRALCCDPPGNHGTTQWAGVDVDVAVHAPSVHAHARLNSLASMLPPVPLRIALEGQALVTRAPMFMQPSAQEGTGVGGPRHSLGSQISTREGLTFEELNHLGQSVHAFLAVDAHAKKHGDVDVDDAAGHRLASRIRQRFQVEELMNTMGLVEIGRRLWAFLDEKLPGHVRRTEVPLLHALAQGSPNQGSTMRGQIDLLVEHEGAFIVIDHKTTFDVDVAGYAGQLRAYAGAVSAATGKPVSGTWIHLPLLGEMVEVILDANLEKG
ncbi:MAG: UvrD-helicase domain-containing protein [Deltaproteobacteria bacterium]|nr:UvrD-helicase domain-containing protein [Deltaproteobacteria bacterium]